MANHSEHSEAVVAHEEHHEHHYTPTSHFAVVFVFLLIMLFATVGAAFVDLSKVIPIPGMNIIVMLVIAILKAAAVVLVFMEVRKGTRLVWLWAAVGFVWFPTMLGILADYWTRNWTTARPW